MIYYIRNDIDDLLGFKYNDTNYYYDKETNLYYLNSRYYNPVWGRFISADVFTTTGQDFAGNNMYLYTGNNFVVRVEIDGLFWFQVVGTFAGAIISGLTKMLYNLACGNKIDDGVLGTAANGAISGLVITLGLPPSVATFLGPIAEEIVDYLADGDKISALEVGDSILQNVLLGQFFEKIGLTIEINSNWFKPQKLSTSLTGNYTQKIVKNMVRENVTTSIIDGSASIINNNLINVSTNTSPNVCPLSGIQNNPPCIIKPKYALDKRQSFLEFTKKILLFC